MLDSGEEMAEPLKSRFIATFRLRPDRCFAGLKLKLTTKDGYELSFHDDMAWIVFDASPDEWKSKLDIVSQSLRTLLAILTIQVEYPFESEPVQWIEDKPRDQTVNRSYVLGRLGPDLANKREPPSITTDHIRKGEIHAHLTSLSPYYRYALLDYSVALSFPREAIVFCARSVDWSQKFFETVKRSDSGKKVLGARQLMRNELKLPKKYLDRFFTIANETVIARHTGDPEQIRSPKIDEIRFCVFFSREVLDRFGGYLWYRLSKELPLQWQYASGEKLPGELFEANNPGLLETLRLILKGELS